MAKAILIDTDNLDLVKLGEVFGTDVAEAIASAIGKEFNAPVVDEDELDEVDEPCDCEDCNCEESEVSDEDESVYGECVVQDENEYRFKVMFSVPHTDADAISVVFTEGGFTVSAESVDGKEFNQEVVTEVEDDGMTLDRSRSTAHLEDGALTVRVYKTKVAPKAGDSIEVQAA